MAPAVESLNATVAAALVLFEVRRRGYTASMQFGVQSRTRTQSVPRRSKMKIGIGSDHAGYRYKEEIKKFLAKLGHEVKDFGTNPR